MAKRVWAKVDDEGRLLLPDDLAVRLGLRPGAPVVIEESEHGLTVKRSPHFLKRIYVEITNKCNLHCSTCIRNTWDATFGHMRDETFQCILDGIHEFSPTPEIFFGGWGEPLVHPHVVEWVQRAKGAGARVLLITNGILLSKEMSQGLIDAGLDVLWVSIDGATPETYADVRLGEYLPAIIENLEFLRDLKAERFGSSPWSGHPRLAIAFVAMKRNISDLPEVLDLGRRLGATEFSISNLMPFSEEMQNEILYRRTMYVAAVGREEDARPYVHLARMDIDDSTRNAIEHLLRGDYRVEFFGNDLESQADACPFVERGSVSIRWDGRVSPCWPLLYDHIGYLGERKRLIKAYHVGNIRNTPLHDLWYSPEYMELRESLVNFDFPPCVYCNGCELVNTNTEDCYGNVHPTCGGCLWAQGFIRCP